MTKKDELISKMLNFIVMGIQDGHYVESTKEQLKAWLEEYDDLIVDIPKPSFESVGKLIIVIMRPNEAVDKTITMAKIKDIRDAGGDIVFMSPDQFQALHEEAMTPVRSNWGNFWLSIHKLLSG